MPSPEEPSWGAFLKKTSLTRRHQDLSAFVSLAEILSPQVHALTISSKQCLMCSPCQQPRPDPLTPSPLPGLSCSISALLALSRKFWTRGKHFLSGLFLFIRIFTANSVKSARTKSPFMIRVLPNGLSLIWSLVLLIFCLKFPQPPFVTQISAEDCPTPEHLCNVWWQIVFSKNGHNTISNPTCSL